MRIYPRYLGERIKSTYYLHMKPNTQLNSQQQRLIKLHNLGKVGFAALKVSAAPVMPTTETNKSKPVFCNEMFQNIEDPGECKHLS